MAYSREKIIRGHRYRYLVQSVREGGKVRQRHIRYLGRVGDSAIPGAYLENIGPLTPIMAEELARAQQRWPAEWVLAAIREAVINNQGRWSYILAILRRYEEKGFGPPRRELFSKTEGPGRNPPAAKIQPDILPALKKGLGNKNAQGPRPRTPVVCRRCGRHFSAVIPKSRPPVSVCWHCSRVEI